MKDLFEGVAGFALMIGFTFGPIFGLYAAVVAGSFLNACLSLLIPYYGIIYWLLS